MQNRWLFSSKNIYFRKCQRAHEKKSKEDEQTLEELNSAQSAVPKCNVSNGTNQLHNTCMKQIKLFLFFPYNKHLINWAKSVCMGESWPQSFVQTSLRLVCTYHVGQDSPIQTSCLVYKSWVQHMGSLFAHMWGEWNNFGAICYFWMHCVGS